MAETTWPDKMITQAEAFAKAAEWPFAANLESDSGKTEITLRCNAKPANSDKGTCWQSMGQLRRGATIYNGSLDEMLSMVLRHMVMAHDVPLNTRPTPLGEAYGTGIGLSPPAVLQDNGPSDGSTP